MDPSGTLSVSKFQTLFDERQKAKGLASIEPHRWLLADASGLQVGRGKETNNGLRFVGDSTGTREQAASRFIGRRGSYYHLRHYLSSYLSTL